MKNTLYQRIIVQQILILTIVILLSSIISSCAKGEKEMTISPLDKSLPMLVTTHYDNNQLKKIANQTDSISTLNEIFPIECIRKDGNLYRVSYLGYEMVAVLAFDANGKMIMGSTYVTNTLKEDFEKVSIGDSLDDVREIDPCGEYLFLFTGRNDSPKLSSHYTKDGYLIIIEYDDNNIIINKTTTLL